MIHPTLYIGLGSAGVKTLLHLHDHILDAYGGHWPEVLQLLAIVSDEPDLKLAATMVHGHIVRVSVGDTNAMVRLARGGEHIPDPVTGAPVAPIPWALNQWLNSVTIANQPSYVHGASNRRQIGHLFLWEQNNFNAINGQLTQLATEACDPISRQQTDALIHAANGGFGDPPRTFIENTLDVFVVGGLTGGTCSGMAPYFGYLVRNNAAVNGLMNPPGANGELVGVFAMPDDVMAGDGQIGIQWTANSYNALRELEYFHYPFPNNDRPHRHYLPNGRSIPPHPDYPYHYCYLLSPRDANGQLVDMNNPVEKLLEVLGYSLALQTISAFADEARAKKGDFLAGQTNPIHGAPESAYQLDSVSHMPRSFFSRGLRAFVHPQRLLTRVAVCEAIKDQTAGELNPVPNENIESYSQQLKTAITGTFDSLTTYPKPAPGQPHTIEAERSLDCENAGNVDPVPESQVARQRMNDFPLPHLNKAPFNVRLNGGRLRQHNISPVWADTIKANAKIAPVPADDGVTGHAARAALDNWLNDLRTKSTATQVHTLACAAGQLKSLIEETTPMAKVGQNPVPFEPDKASEVSAALDVLSKLEAEEHRLAHDWLTFLAGVRKRALTSVQEQKRLTWRKICDLNNKPAKDALQVLCARAMLTVITWTLGQINAEWTVVNARMQSLTQFQIHLQDYDVLLRQKLTAPPVCVKHEFQSNAPNLTEDQKINLEVTTLRAALAPFPRIDVVDANNNRLEWGLFSMADEIPHEQNPAAVAERNIFLNKAMSRKIAALLQVAPPVNICLLLNDGRWNATHTAHVNGTAVSLQFTNNYQPSHNIVPPAGYNLWKVFGPAGLTNVNSHPFLDCPAGTLFFPDPNGSRSTVICYCEDGGFSTTFMRAVAPLAANAARVKGEAHKTDERFPPDMELHWRIPYAKFVLRQTRFMMEFNHNPGDINGAFFVDEKRDEFVLPHGHIVVMAEQDYENQMRMSDGEENKIFIKTKLFQCIADSFLTEKRFHDEWDAYHTNLNQQRTQLMLNGSPVDALNKKIRDTEVYHDYICGIAWGTPPQYGAPGPNYLFLNVVG